MSRAWGLLLVVPLIVGCGAPAPTATKIRNARVDGQSGAMLRRVIVEAEAPPGADCLLLVASQRRGFGSQGSSPQDQRKAGTADPSGQVSFEQAVLPTYVEGAIVHATVRCRPGGDSETVPVRVR